MVNGTDRKVFLALLWLTFRELHSDYKGLKVSERIPLPDQPEHSVAYDTLLNYATQGMEKIIPEGTKKTYSVHELLQGIHFDNQSEGKRMLALAKAENKGGMRWLSEIQNRSGKAKDLNVFGIKIKHKEIIEDLLKTTGKKSPGTPIP
ncbi:MAG: hypothetical protein D3908_02940 [Candidatus Electrothrix sp. AUS4]|nr:hypothetical protein [Candidatus Electrothrix sp. AUS4]